MSTDLPAPGTGGASYGTGRGGKAPAVYWPALVVIVVVAGLAIAFPETAESVVGTIQTNAIGAFGWYYVLLVAGFVAFSLWVGLGRWGDVRLGADDDVPEFGIRTWFSMLFAAGMGIGLVFWGVAEPLSHFSSPKPGTTGSPEALAQTAMAQTYLHWGIHAWAIYVVVGLALAYSIHRRKRPVSIRWALEPLLGDRVRGRLGDAIDVTAVVGTVFGVATSLGLGVLQISAGLDHIGLAASTLTVQVVIIVAVSALATFSVVSGLDRGLKWLSNINVTMAGVFAVCLLVLGPTLFLLREFVQSIGVYLANLLPMTFNVSAFAGEAGEAWQADWTTFYWGWWISWAPFVGVFIARISRGRTVREFIGGVLLVPTLITFLWFSVLGGSALYRELFSEEGLVPAEGGIVPENALFDLLAGLPWNAGLSVVVVVLVTLFFVTSSDSGSLVVAMLTSGGNPVPRVGMRVTWAVLSGLLAIALLAAGGLVALRTAAILIALPFSVVMIGVVIATARALHREHESFLRAERRLLRGGITERVKAELADRVSEQVAVEVETILDSGRGRGRVPAVERPDVSRRARRSAAFLRRRRR